MGEVQSWGSASPARGQEGNLPGAQGGQQNGWNYPPVIVCLVSWPSHCWVN